MSFPAVGIKNGFEVLFDVFAGDVFLDEGEMVEGGKRGSLRHFLYFEGLIYFHLKEVNEPLREGLDMRGIEPE